MSWCLFHSLCCGLCSEVTAVHCVQELSLALEQTDRGKIRFCCMCLHTLFFLFHETSTFTSTFFWCFVAVNGQILTDCCCVYFCCVIGCWIYPIYMFKSLSSISTFILLSWSRFAHIGDVPPSPPSLNILWFSCSPFLCKKRLVYVHRPAKTELNSPPSIINPSWLHFLIQFWCGSLTAHNCGSVCLPGLAKQKPWVFEASLKDSRVQDFYNPFWWSGRTLKLHNSTWCLSATEKSVCMVFLSDCK